MVLGFWFQNISTTLFLVILEKRASRSLAKSGLFSLFFWSIFSSAFLEGRLDEIFQFSDAFGVPWGVTFDEILGKYHFCYENRDLRFLTTVPRFSLIFRVWDLPEGSKNDKKCF